MNTNILYGTSINEYDDYSERKISFKSICRMKSNNELKLPPYQTAHDMDKINEMTQMYTKNPKYLLFKNKCVIGVITKHNSQLYYILDGQHRIEMAINIYNNYKHLAKMYTSELIFCYYYLDSNEEMKAIYNEINKDSLKSQPYILLPELQKTDYEKLKDFFDSQYQQFFSSKKSINIKKYSIIEFLEKLASNKFFEMKINYIKYIEEKNKEFYNLIDYKNYYDNNPNNFYKEEHNNIRDKNIMALKNNNFIDFLINDTIPSHHTFKNKKINSIEVPKIRLEIWYNEYKNYNENKCPMYNCNNIINCKCDGYQVGYIIAKNEEFNISNIRPICKKCKDKMKKKNWGVYENTLKLSDGELL